MSTLIIYIFGKSYFLICLFVYANAARIYANYEKNVIDVLKYLKMS